jgi:hypothetical protein
VLVWSGARIINQHHFVDESAVEFGNRSQQRRLSVAGGQYDSDPAID